MNREINIKPEDRFTRTLFGIMMIINPFINWGKWVVFVLGVLFLISAWQGYCATCEIYKNIGVQIKSTNVDDNACLRYENRMLLRGAKRRGNLVDI